MAKWPWRSRSMTPIFNTTGENPKMHIWCKFDDSTSKPWQVIAWTSQISWNSKSKWPGRSRSMTPIFNTSWEYPNLHVWCKFGDSSSYLSELSGRKAGFPRILSQNGQNDLEGKCQRSPFSIPAESVPGCMFDANLVISAQICDELLCGQTKVYGRTDRQTDRRMDRRRQRQYPFSLKGQGLKMAEFPVPM